MKKYTLTTVDQIVLGGLIGDKSKPLARHSPRSLYADLDYGTVTQIKSSLERLRGYGLAEYFVPLVSNDGKDWRVTEQGLKASMASTPVTPEEPVVLTSPEVRILKWLKEWAKKDDDWVSESQLADELCLTESVTLKALHSLVRTWSITPTTVTCLTESGGSTKLARASSPTGPRPRWPRWVSATPATSSRRSPPPVST